MFVVTGSIQINTAPVSGLAFIVLKQLNKQIKHHIFDYFAVHIIFLLQCPCTTECGFTPECKTEAQLQ